MRNHLYWPQSAGSIRCRVFDGKKCSSKRDNPVHDLVPPVMFEPEVIFRLRFNGRLFCTIAWEEQPGTSVQLPYLAAWQSTDAYGSFTWTRAPKLDASDHTDVGSFMASLTQPRITHHHLVAAGLVGRE